MTLRQPTLAAKAPKHGSRIQIVTRGSLGGETGVPPEASEAPEYVEASIMEAGAPPLLRWRGTIPVDAQSVGEVRHTNV